LPSNLTSDSHRLLHPLASPSCRPLACASGQLSGCAFRPTSDSRHPPTFQPCLRTDLRLAPLINSGLRLRVDFRLAPSINLSARLRADLQLAPSTDLPAPPSVRLPACAFCRSSSPAFRPNLRLSSIVASSALPAGKPLTFVSDQPSNPAFGLNLRSAGSAPLSFHLNSH